MTNRIEFVKKHTQTCTNTEIDRWSWFETEDTQKAVEKRTES